MKSKVWRCKLEHQEKVVAEDTGKARAAFLLLLFDHPEKLHVDVDFLQDVEAPGGPEVPA
jgi:hypothetical protein